MPESVTTQNPRTSWGKRKRIALFILFLLMIAAILMSFIAIRTANEAKNRTNGFAEDVKQLMSIPEDQASPGGGVGKNVDLPEATGNTHPNGNGQ